MVDLNPAGGKESLAWATDGVLQGGYVLWTGSFDNHAVIWQGTAGSVVDLNPPNAASEIRAMAPGIQVGFITTAAGDFGALWRGTAASFVNLGPPGVTLSKIFATTGAVHAGVMAQGNLSRAAVNFGTPNSWVGLQQLLPAPYGGFSQANAVYQDGPTLYVGGWAQNGSTGQTEAILWIGTLPCYANCDQSTAPPILNANDFQCFMNKFVVSDSYTNCDGSVAAPNLNANDFQCFLNTFAAGCS
jgi:hypothetical protein